MKIKISQSARTAILCAADSVSKVRSQDAWRVYDMALDLGVVSEIKRLLREHNKEAFEALCEYEMEEIQICKKKH
jgi:hypothetical protein